MTSWWSQRSTSVPAIGPNSRFGSVATRKTARTAIGGVGRVEDHERERDLVDSIAEQR